MILDFILYINRIFIFSDYFKIKYVFFTLILIFVKNHSVTLAYNLKTRRIFVVGNAFTKKESVFFASAVPIIFKRSRHIVTNSFDPDLNIVPVDVCEKRKVGGSLFNLRYIYKKSIWAEFTTAAGSEHAISTGTTNLNERRRGWDDLVFSTGINIFPQKNIQITPYLIGGIPSKRTVTIVDIFDTFIGTRFFALGAGTEFAYSFFEDIKESFALLAQTRLIHFFTRRWTPLLPCSALLKPGNVTDFLIGFQYRKKRTILETGYDATLFSGQGILLRTSSSVRTDPFVRNSFYLNFAHLFKKFPLFGENKVLLGGGFFVSHAERFDTKSQSYWINFTLIF
jgi:hypothetical protein